MNDSHYIDATQFSLSSFVANEEARTSYALWKGTQEARRWYAKLCEFSRPLPAPFTKRSVKTYQAKSSFVKQPATKMVAALGERLAFTLFAPAEAKESEVQGLIHAGRLEVVNSLLGAKVIFDRETPAEEKYSRCFGRTSMLRILWSLSDYYDQVAASKEVPRYYGAEDVMASEYRFTDKQLEKLLTPEY